MLSVTLGSQLNYNIPRRPDHVSGSGGVSLLAQVLTKLVIYCIMKIVQCQWLPHEQDGRRCEAHLSVGWHQNSEGNMGRLHSDSPVRQRGQRMRYHLRRCTLLFLQEPAGRHH